MVSSYHFLSGNELTEEEIRFLGRFGRHIRHLRKLRGLTQEQLAEEAHISYKYIGEIERGKKKASILVVFRIAQALQLPLSETVRLSTGESEDQQGCILSLIRLFENRDENTLRKGLNLLRTYFNQEG